MSSEEVNRWIRERAARQKLIPECLRREQGEEKPLQESTAAINETIRRLAGRDEKADK